MKKVIVFHLIFIFLLSVILFNPNIKQVYADEAIRISPTDSDAAIPAIYGNTIVWSEYSDGIEQIYVYDVTTGITSPVFITGFHQSWCSIYESIVVWEERRDDISQIYYCDIISPESEPVRIDPTSYNQNYPDIYENKIVWLDSRDGYSQIYMYDISTDTTTRITSSSYEPYYPKIHGNRVVWKDNRDGIGQIYMYDISTDTTTRISPSSYEQFHPAIYENIVVGVDRRSGGNNQIYMYDISSGTTEILSPSSSGQMLPDISGNKIVWYDNRDGIGQIYMYDISTGVDPIRISPTSYYQDYPKIYGNKVVWTDCRNDTYQIYLYTFPLSLSESVLDTIFRRIKDLFIPEGIIDKIFPPFDEFIKRIANGIETVLGKFGLEVKIAAEDTGVSEKPIGEAEEGIPEKERDSETDKEILPGEEEGVKGDTKRRRTPPTIELEIYEGPTYVEADNVCYYRIAAITTGDPAPEVEFSKDDSAGTLGEGKTQVNLYDTSDTYTLTATATNSVDTDTASIDLSWECILELEAAKRLHEVIDEGVIGDIPYVTLHPSDIGYVIGGDGVNTESLIIGDSIQNKGVMGYFAFDLSPLVDKKVASATLRIKTYRLYDDLWGLMWGRIALGLRDYLPLDASDYFKPKPDSGYLYETVFTDDPDFTIVYSSADLKKVVQDSIDSGKKLQFYLASMVVGDSDNDYETDGREFTKETISLIIDLSD